MTCNRQSTNGYDTALADPLALGAPESGGDEVLAGATAAPEIEADVRLSIWRDYFKIALAGTASSGPRNDTATERARAARAAVDQASAIAELVGPLLAQKRQEYMRLAGVHPSAQQQVRPATGRVYEFMRDLLRLPTLDQAGFEARLRQAFTRDGYAALVAGEWSHDGRGEQPIAIRAFDFVAGLFPTGTFALREERISGTSTGILTSEPTGAASRLVSARGIHASVLADGEQYTSNTWVPALVARSAKLFTYTGSAHTASGFVSFLRRGIPLSFPTSPGPGILDTIRGERQRGIVVACAVADELCGALELQALREKLHELPDAATFASWLTAFTADWSALLSSFTATRYLCVAPDVYIALIPPYAGLRLTTIVGNAWADPRVSTRVRRDRTWTLYDVSADHIRFQDDAHPGHHYIQWPLGPQGPTGEGREQNF